MRHYPRTGRPARRPERLERRDLLSGSPLTFDSAFSGDGRLRSAGLTQDLALGPDDSVYVAGLTSQSPFDFQVRKYAANGVVDPSFGGGVVTTDFGVGSDRAYSVAVQADGRVLVAGEATTDEGRRAAVVRYLTNGELDPTFGDAGRVLLPFAAGTRVQGVGVQTTGKIVVASDRFEVARLDDQGALDATFGQSGQAVAANSSPRTASLEVTAGDAILIAGTSSGGNSSSSIAVARFEPDGGVDRDFAPGGVVYVRVEGSFDGGLDATEQPDGAVLVAGETSRRDLFPPEDDLVLARLLPGGVYDPSFGLDGRLTRPMSPGHDSAGAVTVLPNGKILVATTDASGRQAIARFHSDGRLDQVLSTPTIGSAGTAQLVEDSQGRIVGLLYDGFQREGTVVRLEADRSPPGAEVRGAAWSDLDGDGERSPNEPLLVGVTLYADLDSDRVRDPDEPHATTDDAGAYVLAGLAVGDAILRLDGAPGVALTNAAAGGALVVTATLPDAVTTGLLDFEDLAHDGHSITIGNYRSQGFQVTAAASPSSKFEVAGPASDRHYVGSATLRAPWIPNTVTIAREDELPFDLVSIDLAAGDLAFPGGALTLTGHRDDGSTVTANVSSSQTFLQTFVTPQMTGVTRVEWSVSGTGRGPQIDNLRVAVEDDLLNTHHDVGLIFAADFNRDGIVDSGDYTVWRDAVGGQVDRRLGRFVAGDANGDWLINSLDWAIWAQAYGASSPLKPVPQPVPATESEPVAESEAGALIAALDAAFASRRRDWRTPLRGGAIPASDPRSERSTRDLLLLVAQTGSASDLVTAKEARSRERTDPRSIRTADRPMDEGHLTEFAFGVRARDWRLNRRGETA